MAKKRINYTSKTLEYIRAHGWEADSVERFNAFAGKFGQRKDMFGFGDIVALGEKKIIAVQSCDGSHAAEHVKKITEDEYVAPLALKWIECGGVLLMISWSMKILKKGGKAKRWVPRVKKFTVKDFVA